VDKNRALQVLSSSEQGLSEQEAIKRLQQNGTNTLIEGKKTSVVKLFFAQFKDFMTLLLIAAAAVSAVIAFLSRDTSDLTDTFIIVFIIFLNALVGTVQQYRADKAIQSLKKLSAAHVKVKRGGSVRQVNAEELVTGDVILLEEGDIVPADCRVLRASSLMCDESALTGESDGVAKSDEVMPQKSQLTGAGCALFKSTFVVRGNGEAVVAKTGMQTEIGKIADMIEENKVVRTPLEKSLDILGKVISIFVLVVSAIIFVMGLAVRQDGVLKNFMTAVAVAVAAIPEGLPAVVTIIMAMGVQRMSKKNVVIRKLQSVETLGGCNYICTDKTGTLTQNKMRVCAVWTAGNVASLRDSMGGIAGGQEAIPFSAIERALLECFVNCVNVKGERGRYIGDPTETALVAYADERGFKSGAIRLAETPFTSERKRMSVRVDDGGRKLLYAKGAPDVLLKYCTHILMSNGAEPLSQAMRDEILRVVNEYSTRALRVLAFAYSEGTEENDLTFLGLCGMRDGLKAGVKEAVAECERAGISTMMITGDYAATALAIAKELGIADSDEQVMTGEQFESIPPKERSRRIANCRVFARVTPKHKSGIVKALQAGGNVVAMTGDGINDAPSLKCADIGIAMGQTGTEVTKNASDMVIADDNFTTIVSAVREGRRIFANIKKTICFFLSTNLAEVFTILIASLFYPAYTFLLSTQLLWINLITDSFPVLALGVEREDSDSMEHPPVRAEKSLFSKQTFFSVGFFGVYMTVATMVVFVSALHLWGNGTASTMAFLTISFLELFHAFNIRSESRSAFYKLFSNKVLLATVVLAIVVNCLLMVVAPLRNAFGLVALTIVQWLIVVGVSLSVIVVGEVYKLVWRLVHNKHFRT
jgi:Ca2+-transporting ATPase